MHSKLDVMLMSIFIFDTVLTRGLNSSARNLQVTYTDGKYDENIYLVISIKNLTGICPKKEECNTFIKIYNGENRMSITGGDGTKKSESPIFEKIIIPKSKIKSENVRIVVFNSLDEEKKINQFFGSVHIPKNKLFSLKEPAKMKVVTEENNKKPVEINITRFFKISFNIHVVHQPGIGQKNPQHQLYIVYATKVKDGHYGVFRKMEPTTPFPRFTFNIDGEDYAPDLDQVFNSIIWSLRIIFFVEKKDGKNSRLGEITLPVDEIVKNASFK